MKATHQRACIIGSGPNGLAAAIVLAQAGLAVEVYEGEAIPGGAARTLPLTLPGFRHDFGSAVHPMAIGSPFFQSLPLTEQGLEWIHSPAPLAHPLDDGTAVVLERDLSEAERNFGEDGRSWRCMMQPLVDHWSELAGEILGPLTHIPRHPLLLARFGLSALQPARFLASHSFKNPRTRALFAGMAAHSFLSLDQPVSSAVGLILGAAAHAVGWPIPRGGAQSITDALCAQFVSLGGQIHTSTRIQSLDELPTGALLFCDITPRQLLNLSGRRFSPYYRRTLSRYKYGPGAFKIDYALSAPIPWTARECSRAATVHLGGSLEEIAASEAAAQQGRHAERPFVLLAQPSLFDFTRAPAGSHIAWAYCHVPHGSNIDTTESLEGQIERFAPGFRDCILARRIFSPSALQSMDANLVGGDINGGAMTMRQTLLRPGWRNYATSDANVYICSSSTPPGGGVHGMCGYQAAILALARIPR